MEIMQSCVKSEAKKYTSAVGESRIRKICVCCGYSETDKNPRRFRKKIKSGIHRTFNQESLTYSVLCMVNCRDVCSVCDNGRNYVVIE
jgi:hypothetical protein